ncbi:integrase core domain-containing protein [Streptomyces sp. NPDC057651]|uniref:integrase core domain-containing protein n=1 Tax=unclassified Streptomyces TaxID=2593676 RepID=UPI0036BD43B7
MGSPHFLLRDRDTKYTRSFDAVFTADDVEILLSPPRAPRVDAICEGVVGTLRRELLDRILICNEAHAQAALAEYVRHYNGHRPHQSRQQLPPDSDELPTQVTVHQPPGPPSPATTRSRRPHQPVPPRCLTERHRRSSQHRIVFPSGTRCVSALRRSAPFTRRTPSRPARHRWPRPRRRSAGVVPPRRLSVIHFFAESRILSGVMVTGRRTPPRWSCRRGCNACPTVRPSGRS